MAIDDNKVYGLTGAQIKELPGKIDAAKGQSITLTPADYNANSSNWSDTDPANFNCVAMWRVPSGVYTNTTGTTIMLSKGRGSSAPISMVVAHADNSKVSIMFSETRGNQRDFPLAGISMRNDGEENQFLRPIDISKIANNLTTTSTDYVLDASQGKALKDMIDTINAAGYQTASDVQTAIATAISSVMTYKGTVATVNDLPAAATVGDVYNVTATGDNYAWDGSAWDKLSGTVDLSNYYTKSETDDEIDDMRIGLRSLINGKADASTTYTKTEVDTALGVKANSADVYTKNQTDSAISTATSGVDKIEYVTCTATGTTATGFTATTDKTASAVKALIESGKKVSYRCTIAAASGSLLAGTYEFTTLFAGANTSNDIVTGYAVSIPYGGSGLTNYLFVHAGSTVTVQEIKSPTKVSDLTNDSGFQTASDVSTALADYTPTASLGAAALSNDYTDLDNLPTIPTVNNATLTIQKNGTTVQTFTANASANKTANIEVPVITMQTTDPGEGGTLAANNFIAVYTA